MDAWVDRWMDGWMDGQIEWIERRYLTTVIYTQFLFKSLIGRSHYKLSGSQFQFLDSVITNFF